MTKPFAHAKMPIATPMNTRPKVISLRMPNFASNGPKANMLITMFSAAISVGTIWY